MVEPVKKKSNIKKIILGSFLGILIGSVFGITVAMFSYNRTGLNSKLIAGDIYMKYKETSAINLSGAMPSSTYPTTSSGNYFEFQITGKNTSTRDITYNVKLAYGDEETGKDRLHDNHLLFKLVEVVNDEEVAVTPEVNDKSFDTIPGATLYTATIPGGGASATESTRTFRVYARIDENVVIGNTNQDYTIAEWNNSYASVKINVDGGFEQPIPSMTAQKLIQNIKTNNLKTENDTPLNYVTETNNFGTETEQTITYLSGCSKYYLDQGAEGCTQDNTIDFNYVWYSGRMWRITSFNETTNTIKLITQEPQTVIAWHDSSSAFEGSYVKQFLNDEFYDTLYQPTNFIDTSILWDVTETTDVSTKLSNPTITSNVGLLNSYEYYQSYQKVGSSDKFDFGYLNIGQHWWLLNLHGTSRVWFVIGDGYTINGNTSINGVVYPSINLLSDVKFTGSGTKSDPYRLVGDKEVGTMGDSLKDRQVGEYVKLKNGANEQVFRIVSFENNTTKLIALDYADSGNTKVFATANSSGNGTIFGEGNTIDDTNNTTWYSYLKNVYISDLKTKYGSNMFTTGEYYLGINADNPSNTTYYYNYRTSICSSTGDLSKNCLKSRSKTLEAGLLRYGEMFAAQHTIGYDWDTSMYNTKDMWLMTRASDTSVYFVGDNGLASGGYISFEEFAVRPSINLSSGVKILSGTGLPNDPYVVGL